MLTQSMKKDLKVLLNLVGLSHIRDWIFYPSLTFTRSLHSLLIGQFNALRQAPSNRGNLYF